jgi:hypothetical protein
MLVLVQRKRVEIWYIVVKGTDMSVFLTAKYYVMVKSNELIGITEYPTF